MANKGAAGICKDDAGGSLSGSRSHFPVLTERLELSAWLNDPNVVPPIAALDLRLLDTYILRPLVALPKSLGSTKKFDLCVVVRLRENARAIGRIEVAGNQIGFFVEPEYWGRGYATEMVASVCKRLSDVGDAYCLQANVLRNNFASINVLTKCSFRFAGLTCERSAQRAGREVLIFRKTYLPL